MESFEYDGLWYLPENPQNKFAGVLQFTPETGGTLRIIGNSLINQQAALVSEHNKGNNIFDLPLNTVFEFFCGHLSTGDQVTLYKCQLNGETFSDGYGGATLSIKTIFWGYHFASKDDLSFESISVQYTNLDRWIGKSGFEGGIQYDENSKKAIKLDLKYELPEPMEATIQNFTLRFSFGLFVNPPAQVFDTIQVKQTIYLDIIPDAPLTYHDYHEIILIHLRHFFTLAFGGALHTLSFIGKNQKFKYEFETGGTTIKDVYVYYPPIGKELPQKNIQKNSMIFTLDQLGQDWGIYLTRWFDLQAQLQPILSLYFGLFYIPHVYINSAFITLTQVLEAYHRRLYGGSYMSEAEYQPFAQHLQQVVTDIKDNNVSNDHKQSLRNKIKYGYEFSLRKRLKLILNEDLLEYESILCKIIPNKSDFINKVVNTRNYLTHYSKSSEEHAITNDTELREYTYNLQMLFRLCLIKEMGIPIEQINKHSAILG